METTMTTMKHHCNSIDTASCCANFLHKAESVALMKAARAWLVQAPEHVYSCEVAFPMWDRVTLQADGKQTDFSVTSVLIHRSCYVFPMAEVRHDGKTYQVAISSLATSDEMERSRRAA
jgi:hypothetical protein